MSNQIFPVHYIESKVGKTGLTVTIDIFRVAKSTSAVTQPINDGAMTEMGGGGYFYVHDCDLTNYWYFGFAHTETTSVDQQDLACFPMEMPDAVLSTILADTNELQSDWVNGGRLDLLVDAIKAVTDQLTAAQSEPTGAPAADATPLVKLGYVYMALRNKLTVTASAKTFFDDSGNAEWSKSLSDDGTTYTETEGA